MRDRVRKLVHAELVRVEGWITEAEEKRAFLASRLDNHDRELSEARKLAIELKLELTAVDDPPVGAA